MSDPRSEAFQYIAILLARETKRADTAADALVVAMEAQHIASIEVDRLRRDLEIAQAHRDQWQNDARTQEQRADLLEGQFEQVNAQLLQMQREREQAIEDFLHEVNRFEVVDYRTKAEDPGERLIVLTEFNIRMDFLDGHRTLRVVFTNREPRPGSADAALARADVVLDEIKDRRDPDWMKGVADGLRFPPDNDPRTDPSLPPFPGGGTK